VRSGDCPNSGALQGAPLWKTPALEENIWLAWRKCSWDKQPSLICQNIKDKEKSFITSKPGGHGGSGSDDDSPFGSDNRNKDGSRKGSRLGDDDKHGRGGRGGRPGLGSVGSEDDDGTGGGLGRPGVNVINKFFVTHGAAKKSKCLLLKFIFG